MTTQNHRPDQEGSGAHVTSVEAVPHLSLVHRERDTPAATDEGHQSEDGSAAIKESLPAHVSLADPFLALAADVLDDLERTRIANENRLRQLTRSAEDSDGETRGFGLSDADPEVARLAALVEALQRLEHQAELDLARQLRRHPLWPWMKAQRGIGAKQGARLLAAIRDPYWNDLHGRPRTVSELWAFSGLKPGQKRQKGVKSNWSPTAKMRSFLVAVSCMKAGGPYRDVYLERREHTAVTQPAWTDGHSHNDALRVAGKAILRDLWRESKRLHKQSDGHVPAAVGPKSPADQAAIDARTIAVDGDQPNTKETK